MKIESNFHGNSLKEEARRLIARGFSVIPVLGDSFPANPKKPAIAWKQYQNRLATVQEVDRWFSGKANALGIVCGRASKLMVVDFDDYAGYRRFRRRFPEYMNAYTVKTRRGYHVYFRTSEKLSSQCFDSGDLKGEGGFVIAPPSVIAGIRYESLGGAVGPELDRAELDEIVNFLVMGCGREKTWFGSDDEVDLIAMYRRLANEVGRNNALYRCASIGRDRGASESDLVERLGHAHATQTNRSGNKFEKIAERWLEAVRTIKSAFAGSSAIPGGEGLPNSVREFFLQSQGSTIVARLLDIFGMMRWKAGTWRTLREIVEAAGQYRLGRRSVIEALTGKFSVHRGRPIIKSRYVEYLDIREPNRKSCGRPIEKLYRIPAVSELVRLLAVRWSPSDMLQPEDLKSAHAYRLALHREYIRRLSPQAPQSWLGRRLGLSDRSIRRFNSELGVQAIVKVGLFDLDRRRLKLLPKRRGDEKRWATPGYWLQTNDGRRWPAWRHIGSRLLRARGGNVKVCMRLGSQLRLQGSGGVLVEALDADVFARLELARRMRDGRLSRAGVMRELLEALKREAEVLRYRKMPLFFDSVTRHIAPDRVAESIEGYLVAQDAEGRLVKRPALRGVAYRMLKEFGDGNVQLALRDRWNDVRYALARHMADMSQRPALNLAGE